ncbi:major facilitator superfamily domain-containing protein [Aspergillus pseudoustus]|uniref:Major facilitator superfamily domain-containing protein n=1 Tax=Aspergillus pseudoustus TaxID=1810923 RepID=A0ABR4JET2_9EURO
MARMGDTIESRYDAVPGTEILVDQGSENNKTTPDFSAYQHVTRGDARILLVPQPSLADPNDPLRWSKWKKWLVFANGLLYAFNGAVTGPMMAGGMLQLSAFFSRPLADITYSNGATLICQGFGTLLWMPLAVKFGRRPVYLSSAFLMGIACVWLAVAAEKTYPVFVLARTFLGLWEAPIEAIVPSTVTDIFYLHERGEKVSIYGLSVLGGNELGPLVSAYIIQALSMRWAFFIVAMFIGVNVVTMFFFMPETKFTAQRPVIRPGGDGLRERREANPKSSSEHREMIEGSPTDVALDIEAPSPAKRTFIQELAFCSVIDHDVSLWRVFRRPFVLLAYPTVLWASLVYGMSLSWNVILGSLVAQLFGPPPYNFSSGSQGLIFISPLLGSLVGTYLCGPIADQVATFFTIRNNGIREPEMRLPTCLVAALLTFLGALISGLTYHYQTHWSGPIVGFGVLSTGAQMGATLSMSYALDCHIELSAEIMVTISCLKSAVAWIWTWCINDWVEANGLLVVFMVIASLNVVVYGSTLGFYFWGKRVRLWIHEKRFMR